MAKGGGQKGVIVFAYVQPFSVHLFTVNYGNVSRVDVEVAVGVRSVVSRGELESGAEGASRPASQSASQAA